MKSKGFCLFYQLILPFIWDLDVSYRMKVGVAIMGIGIVTIVFGMLFYLQGNSIVGPTSSFMYSNPKWIVNGQWIAVSGVLILAAGLGISLRRPRS